MTGLDGMQGLAAVCIALLTGICWGVSLNSRAAPRGKRPEGRKTSNVILLALGLFTLAFVTAMTVIFCVKGAVPDTLIQYTLGAGGGEALLLAGIKVSKVLKGGGENEEGFSLRTADQIQKQEDAE